MYAYIIVCVVDSSAAAIMRVIERDDNIWKLNGERCKQTRSVYIKLVFYVKSEIIQ